MSAQDHLGSARLERVSCHQASGRRRPGLERERLEECAWLPEPVPRIPEATSSPGSICRADAVSELGKAIRCAGVAPFAGGAGWRSIAAAGIAAALMAAMPVPTPVPVPPPSFAGMVDQDGRALPLDKLAGKLVLMNFIFAGCGDTCPLQTAELAAMRAGLSPRLRQTLRIVSISVDPVNDTPAALRRFAANFGARSPEWSFLTGNRDAMLRLVRQYDALGTANRTSAASMHSTEIILLNAAGHVVRRYPALPLDRSRVARDLELLARFPQLQHR